MAVSKCGVVIKGVDRSRRVTISRIAVPLTLARLWQPKLQVCACSRESLIWSSTNACVFRVSTSASTESSTNNDVAICELVFCKNVNVTERGRVCRSVSRASEIQNNVFCY